MDQKKVGRFIAECRKEKGLTQAQLAEQFGISNRAVSNWETGKSLPDASIMIDLSNYLGITVNELLSGGRIDMEDYKDIAEQTIVDVQKGKEKLKKKYSVIIIAIVLAILILCYFALKFLLVDKVISNLGNLNNGFIDAEEIDFVIKDQENPIEDNGIVFDDKYSFKKESDDSIKSYVSEDKKIKLYVYKPINYVTLENEQWQDIIYSNGFVSKFLLGNNAFVKYTTKNRITSYPELLLDTYIHSGPISHGLIFSLLPNYRQEIVRGTLKYSLVDDRADRFYYAELEDYIVTIETYDNERVYSFTAYDRNSQQEFFVTLENDTYSLSKEEIFEVFESVSLAKKK
ncbi:MAG: helix-turn-helix transcriptional regulator [Oscillospiraceae bacterium]|nr:helix-turn-helix transcriptional regulator [Candidatus Limimonas egerieequi]